MYTSESVCKSEESVSKSDHSVFIKQLKVQLKLGCDWVVGLQRVIVLAALVAFTWWYLSPRFFPEKSEYFGDFQEHLLLLNAYVFGLWLLLEFAAKPLRKLDEQCSNCLEFRNLLNHANELWRKQDDQHK